MAREKKFASPGGEKETPAGKLIETIVEDVIKAKAISIRSHKWVWTQLTCCHKSVVVGLAIDAIGLRFQVEDARRFTKAGRQHFFAEDRFATTLDGRILHGSSVQMTNF